jgi:probable HAF family extracellular repeat protein
MRRFLCALLIAAVTGCGDEARVIQPPVTFDHERPSPPYQVVELSTSLGGTLSRGNSINGRGWVAGWSNLAGDETRHAALWRGGSLTDLGTLGGPNSTVQWPGQNDGGMIVGIAETATLETLGEEWSCSSFFSSVTHRTCLGFVWQAGAMKPLPTLGGPNGFATGVNARGQVVGWAETRVQDPTCNAPQVLQFRAVLWEPGKHRMRELAPLPGDSTSAATAINDRGQAVGISGECDVAVGRFSARHAVLWDHGRVFELPNLGGVTWHTPMAINARGDVVGFSNPPGPGDPEGDFIAHAFLWTRTGGIRDLGTLPEDAFSEAFGVNERGEVVGVSFGGTSGSRAFLWRDGVMTDLNDLVRLAGGDRLLSAQDIDAGGRITGRVLQQSSGKTLAFVATPTGDRH